MESSVMVVGLFDEIRPTPSLPLASRKQRFALQRVALPD
jgi:hypothetical protein